MEWPPKCMALLGIQSDVAAATTKPKISPESVAEKTLMPLKPGQIEVLADERSRFVKASLSQDHELINPPVQAFWYALG
jgi:hypothetical protein